MVKSLKYLFPLECALLPLVDEAHHEYAEEHHHRREAEAADLLQHDRPGEEKRDLEIEQYEENGDQVVADVEFHAGVLERLEAALVRRELLRVGPVHAEQPREPAA